MKIISLKCNNCSADLDIPEKTKFFKCSFCKSSLGIKHSGNAIYTEVLDEIKEDTSQILENTEDILIEKKIARLDRDWEQTKASFTTYSKEGVPSLPDEDSAAGSFVGILIFGFIFVFLISTFHQLSSSSFSNKSERISHPMVGTIDKKFFKQNPHLKNSPHFKKQYKKLQRNNGKNGLIILVIIFIIGIAAFSASSSDESVDEYNKAKSNYEKKRKALLRELDEL